MTAQPLTPRLPAAIEELWLSYLWPGSRALLTRAGLCAAPTTPPAESDPTAAANSPTNTEIDPAAVDQRTLINLIKEGWTEGVKILAKAMPALNWEAALEAAAGQGNTEIMSLCEEKGALDWLAALLTAAEKGQTAAMLRCAERGTTSLSYTYYDDERNLQEDLECIKPRKDDWNRALRYATSGGHAAALETCEAYGADAWWSAATQAKAHPVIAKHYYAKAALVKAARAKAAVE